MSDTEFFTVKKLLSEKCVEHCGAVCPFCNTCLHMYSCTCHEYLLFNTMCQHIHSVSLMLFPNQKHKKQTLKYADHITDRTKCKKVNQNSSHLDSMSTNDKLLLTDINRKETEIINFFNQNFEQQQCEQKLQEGRVRLKQKLNFFSEICSTKIDQIGKDSLHLVCINRIMRNEFDLPLIGLLNFLFRYTTSCFVFL